MIQDAQNTFSRKQPITATAVSENVVDFGAVGDFGVGTPMFLVVSADVALVGAGTVTVTIEQDDNSDFTSATVTQTLGVFPSAAPAGSKLVVRFAHGAVTERYVRLRYTVAGGNLTAGTLTATIVKDVDAYTAYPDAFNIQ